MRDLSRGTLHLLLQALVGTRWLSTCFQGAITEVYIMHPRTTLGIKTLIVFESFSKRKDRFHKL
jgi:hypothetical protein